MYNIEKLGYLKKDYPKENSELIKENLRLRHKLINIETAFKKGVKLLCKDFKCPTEIMYNECNNNSCMKSTDAQNEIARQCWKDYLIGGVYEYEFGDE